MAFFVLGEDDIALLLAAAQACGPAWAQGAEPALSRVMLSSGGVGYVEYEATVAGNATLRLPVPLAQVDDVLKSLVVFDSAGGVGAVTLPGQVRKRPLNVTGREVQQRTRRHVGVVQVWIADVKAVGVHVAEQSAEVLAEQSDLQRPR